MNPLALLRGLSFQGFVGIIVGIALAGLLAIEKVDHAHTRRDLSTATTELSAARGTIINYVIAAEQARRADAENKARVEREQAAITEKVSHDYEARLADARARAERLRQQLSAAANPGGGGSPSVPGPGGSPGGAPGAPAHPGLPPLTLDERLIATEQAIQLDELISWVTRQTAVQVDSSPSSNPTGSPSPSPKPGASAKPPTN